MAERLAVAEDRLARLMREDTMKSLAEAKLQLAQADFDILELQVVPSSGLLLTAEGDDHLWPLSELLSTLFGCIIWYKAM